MYRWYKVIVLFLVCKGTVVSASHGTNHSLNRMNQQHQQRVNQHLQDNAFQASMAHARTFNQSVVVPVNATPAQRCRVNHHNTMVTPLRKKRAHKK